MYGFKDLAERYAKERGISKAQAQEETKCFVETMGSMIAEEGISLKGMFTIKHHIRKGRTGKRPGTDIEYTTEDKKVLKITTGSDMSKELNG